MLMPPPYWRSSGGIFHVQRSVEDVAEKLLPQLVEILHELDLEVDEHGSRVVAAAKGDLPESDLADVEDQPLADIVYDLMEVEAEIIRLVDLAIFMAAVEAESAINMVAVFNVHKDAAEALEKLGPPDKLILLTALVGAPPVKGRSEFESIGRLTRWRNAAAHGHCVDQPTSSLRRNHLIAPQELPSIPAKLAELESYLEDFFRVNKYLQSISKNPYTADTSWHDGEIRRFLTKIKSYEFTDVQGRMYAVTPPPSSGS